MHLRLVIVAVDSFFQVFVLALDLKASLNFEVEARGSGCARLYMGHSVDVARQLYAVSTRSTGGSGGDADF